MLFNSFEFLLFFPIVVILYFLLPYRYRWVLLLIASYYFYMSWKVEYIVLIIISTLIDYFVSKKMASLPDKKSRRKYLYLSLLSNLGILFGFKYFNFFTDNINQVFEQFSLFYHLPELRVLLPVGISFYTFQTLSYTIDVYNDKLKPERHLGIFAVFVAFFPQLVAGPIERAPHLLPQFRKHFDFDYIRVKAGLLLMLWGFFKKIVIADRVADYVNMVYDAPAHFDGLTHLIATYFFAFQIYCDFSGYSDIAIGSAAIMGYDLMVNFKRPYFARSVQDFWSRWHISLSTWFRDYLYIPLGGNRVVKWRWWYNLMVTFLVSGFWHGANWTFIAWGGIHGGLLVLGIWTDGLRQRFYKFTGLAGANWLRRFIQTTLVFHLVIVAWVFFRAGNVQEAAQICKSFIHIRPSDVGGLYNGLKRFGLLEFFISAGAIFSMEIIHSIQERGISISARLAAMPFAMRWSIYVFACVAILLFGKFSSQAEFIYFQF